jgi:hypothetical protein
VTDVTASSIVLAASAGVGAARGLELGGQTLSADTKAGAVNLVNASAAPVSVLSLRTGAAAPVTFDQSGGGIATVQQVASAGGDLTLAGTTGLVVGAAGAVQSKGGAVSLSAPSLVQEAGGAIGAGAGSITLAADAVDLNGAPASISGSGTLEIRPQTAGTAITLGTGGLDGTALNTLADGFASITIGSPAAGPITVDGTVVFRDPVRLVSGGELVINQAVVGQDNASLTLEGTATQLNAAGVAIDTNGGDIRLAGSITLGADTTLDALGVQGGNPVRGTVVLPGDVIGGGNDFAVDAGATQVGGASIAAGGIAFTGGVELTPGTDGEIRSTWTTDRLGLAGAALSGAGELVLLPATAGTALDIGGGTFLGAGSPAAFGGFGGALSIGGKFPAASPETAVTANVSAIAGDIRISEPLAVGAGASLALVSLGDISLGDPITVPTGTATLIAIGATGGVGAGDIFSETSGLQNVTARDVVLFARSEIGTQSVPLGVTLSGVADVAAGADTVFLDLNGGTSVSLGPATQAIKSAFLVQFPFLAAVGAPDIRDPFGQRGQALLDQGLEEEDSSDIALIEVIEVYTVEAGGLHVPWYADEALLEWKEEDWVRFFESMRRRFEREGRSPEEFERFREEVTRWRQTLAGVTEPAGSRYDRMRYVGRDWSRGGIGVDDHWWYLAAAR